MRRVTLAKDFVNFAIECLKKRYSVIPCDPKSKKPLISWKKYQHRLPTISEIKSWSWPGIALICGEVSGNIEVLDFDCKGIKFKEWSDLVRAENPELFQRLTIQKTQNGGYHVIYKCREIQGNQKVAYLRIPAPGKKPGEQAEFQGKNYPVLEDRGEPVLAPCAVETRGQGGYVLISPTAGYQFVQGDIETIPTISPEERETLIQCALVLNEYIKPQEFFQVNSFESDPDLPGSVFNSQGIEIIRQILKEVGWVHVRTFGDRELWRRPGKNSGNSASLLQGRIFYNFSSNASPFEPNKAYSLFAVYTLLKCNGDFKKAARELAKTGFGELRQTEKIVVMKNFTPRPYTEKILEEYKVFSDEKKGLYIFDTSKGIWREGEQYLRTRLRQSLLGLEQQKQHYVNEIIADLKDFCFDPGMPELPDPDVYLIPFKDNVYNLKTEELEPYKPEHYFTFKLPIRYNPNAECPLIDKVFSELVDDPVMLYDLVGYCLWREYNYQKIFFLYGSGSNGKSVFLDILTMLLGKENIVSIDLFNLMENRFATAELYRKHVALAGELPYKELVKTDILKRLTGGDLIRAEQKYKNPFQFFNYAKIIVNTNDLPATGDKTHAFYRRLYLIQFPNQFKGKKADKGLLQKITQEELEGLAVKAIEHLKGFVTNNFTFQYDPDPDEIAMLYEKLTNPLATFLEEFTEQDHEGYIPKHHLNEAFRSWQTLKRLRVWTDKEINRHMQLLGYRVIQKRLSQSEVDEFLSHLSQMSHLFSNKFYSNEKLFKKPCDKCDSWDRGEAKEHRWRCWHGLRWKLPENLSVSDGKESMQSETKKTGYDLDVYITRKSGKTYFVADLF